MIYRIIVDHRYHAIDLDGRLLALSWKQMGQPGEEKLTGAGYGLLADVMMAHGLHAPVVTNARARFYFTEAGWQQVGRHVAAAARRLGHVVRVLRRKNPAPSQVIYRDPLQVAVLPAKDAGGK